MTKMPVLTREEFEKLYADKEAIYALILSLFARIRSTGATSWNEQYQ